MIEMNRKRTVETVILRVSNAPDVMDSQGGMFRPNEIRLIYVRYPNCPTWRMVDVELSGQRILKSGRVSHAADAGRTAGYEWNEYSDIWFGDAPEWVKDLPHRYPTPDSLPQG